MYDVIIIGGGPSGLTCALYATRAGLKTLMLEKMFPGGQMSTTSEIENFPGFENINGADLALNMEKNAKKFGTEIQYYDVESVDLSGRIKKVTTSAGVFEAKTVIVCSGARRRELGVPGEKELAGMGVSYCATCDGNFYRGKTVAVIGGGNVALEDAEYLSKICQKVYLIHRRNEFRGSKVLQDVVIANKKIEILYDTVLDSINGSTKIESMTIRNVKTAEVKNESIDGIFIAVGTIPNNELIKNIIDTDDEGYVVANEDCRTSLTGVFVAGDLRKKPLKQIITAASDGAVAAYMAGKYISEEYSN